MLSKVNYKFTTNLETKSIIFFEELNTSWDRKNGLLFDKYSANLSAFSNYQRFVSQSENICPVVKRNSNE